MSFLYGGSAESLEMFLTRVKFFALGWVPASLALVWFLSREEGWRMSFLLLCAGPPVAAWLGVRAQREIRPGLAWAALATALVPFALMLAVEALAA
ncbi:hypothetical protein [Streptomyces sp. HNM0574]|uniref:hypothetical protein n=1 Tax=Streptomyces sp. HNM0574 TaxID=2714954 RepID=UPI00146B3CFB|nr:hypothetical protein [Streptomyces sp. HNM0574]NLU68384.1 hypothetical protein [Streptomyces sp. HNM0574]